MNVAIQGRRVLVLAAVAGLSLLAPRESYASISLCRTDPVVWLNNGVNVDLTTSFQLQPSNVRSIQYALHIPSGTSVTQVVYTGGKLSQLESMTVYADDTANTYDSSSVVYSKVTGVAVQASEQVIGPDGTDPATSFATGHTNQYVQNHVQR